MFKKSLTAVALFAAFGSAYAANVSVYGVVDEALYFTHNRTTTNEGTESDNEFVMESGINAPSRWGLQGSEDLGNGLTVAFKLENGFSADDGRLGNGDRLFGREASLSVIGDFGTVSFGRMGGVASSAGTYDIVYGMADVYDGFDLDVGGLAISDRYDNMITYQTPKFSGVQATFQYSFKGDSKADGDEGKAKADRYASFALTGEFGPLNTVLAYENFNYSSEGTVKDDGHIVYLGGNYDCGFAKTFAMVQYFKGAKNAFAMETDDLHDIATDVFESGEDLTFVSKGMKGFGLHLGTNFEALGGNITVGTYYTDGKLEGLKGTDGEIETYNIDMKYFGLSARYEYPLSKRTSIYGGAGYAQVELEKASVANGASANLGWKDRVTQAYVGMTHRF